MGSLNGSNFVMWSKAINSHSRVGTSRGLSSPYGLCRDAFAYVQSSHSFIIRVTSFLIP